MTVGELVEAALTERFEEDIEQTYCLIPELRSARNVVRELGIWDAEVLEGCAWADSVRFTGRLWADTEGGQRVRVIVLPEEEKK